MTPRYAAKADGNQAEIVAALRSVGASVTSLHRVGDGCPDLLIGFRGKNYVIEVKQPGEKLTDDQIIWHREWEGQKDIAYHPDDALTVIGAI